jgi:DNA-binding beta-propeller fold protein YncE
VTGIHGRVEGKANFHVGKSRKRLPSLGKVFGRCQGQPGSGAFFTKEVDMAARKIGHATWALGLATLYLLVPSCKEKGGGNPSLEPDPHPPEVQVLFPPPTPSYTDADAINLKGCTEDMEGVRSVTVNGVKATSGDGFAHWTAVVPLSPGWNVLRVSVVDGQWHRGSAIEVAELFQGSCPLVDPACAANDAAHGRILAFVPSTEDSEAYLVAIDPSTGGRRKFSGHGAGSGIDLADVFDIAVDPERNRAILSDRRLGAILEVDLETGNRRILSGLGHGEGPELDHPNGIGLEAGGRSALAIDSGRRSLFRIALGNGDRRVLSSDTVGEGPAFPAGPMALAIDVPGVRTFVKTLGAVLAVDLSSGDRRILWRVDRFAGQRYSGAAIHFDAWNSRVIIPGFLALIAIDIATGAENYIPQGFCSITDIAPGPEPGTVMVTDVWSDALTSVDLDTGYRVVLCTDYANNGPPIASPRGLALDLAGGRAIVADYGSDSLIAVDLATGDRYLFSGTSRGEGPSIVCPRGLALDPEAGRLYALGVSEDGMHGLYSIDLTTGDRAAICITEDLVGSGSSHPDALAVDRKSGTAYIGDDTVLRSVSIVDGEPGAAWEGFGKLVDLAIEPGGSWLLTVDDDRTITKVSLPGGERTLVAGRVDDLKAITDSIVGLEIDFEANRAILSSNGKLFAVDLSTGDKDLLDGGRGAKFGSLRNLRLDADRRIIYATDSAFDSLDAIDLESGDAVVVSK